MPKRHSLDRPIEVVAEHGEVILDGPNGIVASLTPDAADQSAIRLSNAARAARQQSNGDPK